MLNLSPLTAQYLQVTYPEEARRVILSSFTLLEAFGLKFYEDKYVSLISDHGRVDRETMRDYFDALIRQDVLSVITSHRVTVDLEQEVTLTDLNELAHFLFLIQSLEDYREVNYILTSTDSSKTLLTRLITRYTLLSEPTIRGLIASVDDSLIAAIRAMAADRDTEDDVTLDRKHHEHVQRFFQFIGETPCLGRSLYDQGWTNSTLTELISLALLDIPEHVERHLHVTPEQVALDVLSLLIVTTDDYALPLLKLSQQAALVTPSALHLTKLTNIITKMLGDFTNYIAALQQEEIHRDR